MLHVCTLLQRSTYTYALLVHLCRYFPLLTFCHLHSRRNTCWGKCPRRAVCECMQWLLATSPPHCKKGWFPTDYDLGQGQAAGPGPRLCCAGSRDFGELAVTFGCRRWRREKGSVVEQRSFCVRLGTYTLLRGSSLPGRSGSTAWFSLMQPLSCRCPLVQQDGSAALPSAFCPHPREMSCPFEWSSRHTPGDRMASTVWKLCPEVAFYSFLK